MSVKSTASAAPIQQNAATTATSISTVLLEHTTQTRRQKIIDAIFNDKYTFSLVPFAGNFHDRIEMRRLGEKLIILSPGKSRYKADVVNQTANGIELKRFRCPRGTLLDCSSEALSFNVHTVLDKDRIVPSSDTINPFYLVTSDLTYTLPLSYGVYSYLSLMFARNNRKMEQPFERCVVRTVNVKYDLVDKTYKIVAISSCAISLWQVGGNSSAAETTCSKLFNFNSPLQKLENEGAQIQTNLKIVKMCNWALVLFEKMAKDGVTTKKQFCDLRFLAVDVTDLSYKVIRLRHISFDQKQSLRFREVFDNHLAVQLGKESVALYSLEDLATHTQQTVEPLFEPKWVYKFDTKYRGVTEVYANQKITLIQFGIQSKNEGDTRFLLQAFTILNSENGKKLASEKISVFTAVHLLDDRVLWSDRQGFHYYQCVKDALNKRSFKPPLAMKMKTDAFEKVDNLFDVCVVKIIGVFNDSIFCLAQIQTHANKATVTSSTTFLLKVRATFDNQLSEDLNTLSIS